VPQVPLKWDLCRTFLPRGSTTTDRVGYRSAIDHAQKTLTGRYKRAQLSNTQMLKNRLKYGDMVSRYKKSRILADSAEIKQWQLGHSSASMDLTRLGWNVQRLCHFEPIFQVIPTSLIHG